MSLRPLLDAVWAGALGDTSAFGAIKSGLGTFYLSEYCHSDGPDYAQGPAAASVLHGCTDFALFASCESLEAADRLARGGRGVRRGPRGTAPPAEGPGPHRQVPGSTAPRPVRPGSVGHGTPSRGAPKPPLPAGGSRLAACQDTARSRRPGTRAARTGVPRQAPPDTPGTYLHRQSAPVLASPPRGEHRAGRGRCDRRLQALAAARRASWSLSCPGRTRVTPW